jgi:membrane fusion protein (multidrug efflux system)
MQSFFSRSSRFLETDGTRRLVLHLSIAIAILALWLSWFFFAGLPIFAVTETAFFEVEDTALAIQAPVSGKVRVSRLELGKTIDQGDILIEFDTEPERAQLRVEQARLPGLQQQVQALEIECWRRQTRVTVRSRPTMR